MKAQLLDEVLSLMGAAVKSHPSSVEFEMAYQVRVAIDRIRFAIKATEQFAQHPEQLQEAGIQLLDALDRLEAADRDFLVRFRRAPVERRAPLQNAPDDHMGHGRNGAGL
jgi:hypothetical protein